MRLKKKKIVVALCSFLSKRMDETEEMKIYRRATKFDRLGGEGGQKISKIK